MYHSDIGLSLIITVHVGPVRRAFVLGLSLSLSESEICGAKFETAVRCPRKLIPQRFPSNRDENAGGGWMGNWAHTTAHIHTTQQSTFERKRRKKKKRHGFTVSIL